VGIVGSFTLGAGQFCTKPGLVFIPDGAAGDRLVERMAEEVSQLAPKVMLNSAIATGYLQGLDRLQSAATAQVLSTGTPGAGEGFEAVPILVSIRARDLTPQVAEECFGPVAVVARYATDEDLMSALATLPASLTATVLRGRAETDLPGRVSHALRGKAGRLIFEIRRFLRPVTFQGAPSELLPPELREEYRGVPRRVDGALRLADRAE
jgi:NADP-dependent aldehyde dehydrogenase